MTHWIMQCNPKRYRLRDALQDGFDVTTWTVARYLRDIAPGDEIAIWVSGPDAGVYGLGEVTSGAEHSAVEPDPYWVDPADADRVTWHVGIRLGEPLLEPIPRSALAADPEFADAAIIRMPGGGNPFPVTDPQWNVIVSRFTGRCLRRTRSNSPDQTG